MPSSALTANDQSEDFAVTVCDKCHRACCWQGEFMCDKARNAGTINVPVSLLRRLALESPDYWQRGRL